MDSVSLQSQSQFMRRSVADLQSRLSDVQRQVATGKRAETHGGLGASATVVQAMRAQLGEIDGFARTIDLSLTRMSAMQASLYGMGAGAAGLRDEINGALYRNDVALPFLQPSAQNRLEDMVGRLNLEIEGRHLFSGRSTDVRPVAEAEAILNGEGGRAGLRQTMDARAAADADPAGLMATSKPTADSVRIADASAAFGLHLAGVQASGAASAAEGPALAAGLGVPDAGISDAVVTFAGPPAAGEATRFDLRLPDGSRIELAFVAGAPAGAAALENEPGDQVLTLGFAPGATAADAADNLRAALDQALADVAGSGVYQAASRAQGAEDFFAADGPRVVAGAGLVEGAPDEVVHWYRGDRAGEPEDGQRVRIAEGQVVSYGVRADQAEIRGVVQAAAMIAAESDTAGGAPRYAAFAARVAADLGRGADEMVGVQGRLGGKEALLDRTLDAHERRETLLSTRVAEAERADPYEAATRLAELRQQLEATFAVTGRLQSLSLVNYMR